MRFDSVKVIEDRSKGKFKKSIKISKQCLFIGPTNIQDAEFWEQKLIDRSIPYVLAQFETTVSDNIPGSEELISRYARGYGIFVCKEDLDAISEQPQV